MYFFFFFNDTATTEIYTLSLHDALPIFIGARGEQFNRFASEAADGVFLGGIPRSRLLPTVAWAHSVRDIAVSAYPAALFDESRLEATRPRMIYALLDAPEVTRCALGVRIEDAR